MIKQNINPAGETAGRGKESGQASSSNSIIQLSGEQNNSQILTERGALLARVYQILIARGIQ